MNFPSPLIKGVLIKRYRRSLADVRLGDGQVITAHVFCTGPMTGCTSPGSTVLLSDSGQRSRKNPLTWELVDVDGIRVGVNPKIAKHALLEAITHDEVDALRGYRLDDGTVPGIEGSNDVLLQSMKDNCLINHQSVLWVEGGSAFFPEDSGVTAHKNLERLVAFARSGHRAVACYHVLREDCSELRLSGMKDQEYPTLVEKAMKAGVELFVFRAEVSTTGVSLGVPIPFIQA